jgi:protein-tyrosine phosphatase
MRAQLFWIETTGDGKLAILARPRGGDWLRDEVRSWREQGIDVVASLLDEMEIDELGLTDESTACAAAGIEFTSVPVPDRGVPESAEAFGEVVSRLSDVTASGKSVGVHCRAGVGRSAMLAASMLVAAGASPDEAFERVRVARGSPVPDTPEQRAWVEQFARRFPVKAV